MNQRGKIIEKRREKKWTQDKLAEEAKCSRGLISNIERGAALPSLSVALNISNALGLSVEEIFFDLVAQKVSRKGRKKIYKGDPENGQ